MFSARVALTAVGSAGLIGVGYLSALLTWPAEVAAQSDVPATLSGFLASVNEISGRLADLETAVKDRATIPAPLKVVGTDGQVLAEIGSDAAGRPRLALGEGIVLDYSEGEPRVSIFNSAGRIAGMTLRDGGAHLYAGPGDASVVYTGFAPDVGLGTTVYDGAGSKVAQFGLPNSRRASVRFFDGETVLAGIGISIESGGGSVVAKSPDGQQGVLVGAGPAGAHVDVVRNNVQVTSMNTLDKAGVGQIIVRNESGKAVAYLTRSGSGDGGNVTVTDPAGNSVFSAGFAGGGGGEACVTRKGGKGHCLGINLPLAAPQ